MRGHDIELDFQDKTVNAIENVVSGDRKFNIIIYMNICSICKSIHY